MGQQEVYDLLKKHKGRWFTSKEIAKLLMASLGSITTSLKKLRDSSAIDFEYRSKIGTTSKNAYVYRFRR